MSITNPQLLELSVIVHAGESQEHDYTNIHHGFLVSRGVIPNDWDQEEFLIAPPFSRVTYTNGVTLMISDDRFLVNQDQGLEFMERGKPPGLTINYLTAVAPIRFDGIDIRWRIKVSCNDPYGLIRNRILRPGIIDEGLENTPSDLVLTYKKDDLDLTFNFVPKRKSDGGEESESTLRIRCTVGKRGVAERDDLIAMLSEWSRLEGAMLSNLEKLLEVEFNAT